MEVSTNRQLILPLPTNLRTTFANFVAGENQQLIQRLSQTALGQQNGWIYVWGPSEAGKSHVLQATCQLAQDAGQRVFYLAGNELDKDQGSVLEGLELFDLLVIDDLPSLLGNDRLEESLFYLYNRTKDRGGRLVVAADRPPRQLTLSLADLKSRLAALEVYRLQPLTDDGKAQLLDLWAKQRSFSLEPDVITYILSRVDRQLSTLATLVENLDRFSLAEKRRVTIPFVKQVIDATSD